MPRLSCCCEVMSGIERRFRSCMSVFAQELTRLSELQLSKQNKTDQKAAQATGAPVVSKPKPTPSDAGLGELGTPPGKPPVDVIIEVPNAIHADDVRDRAASEDDEDDGYGTFVVLPDPCTPVDKEE